MDTLIQIVSFISTHILEIIGAIVTLLTGVLGISLLIPGEHPDKELQAMVDFLTKFSKK